MKPSPLQNDHDEEQDQENHDRPHCEQKWCPHRCLRRGWRRYGCRWLRRRDRPRANHRGRRGRRLRLPGAFTVTQHPLPGLLGTSEFPADLGRVALDFTGWQRRSFGTSIRPDPDLGTESRSARLQFGDTVCDQLPLLNPGTPLAFGRSDFLCETPLDLRRRGRTSFGQPRDVRERRLILPIVGHRAPPNAGSNGTTTCAPLSEFRSNTSTRGLPSGAVACGPTTDRRSSMPTCNITYVPTPA